MGCIRFIVYTAALFCSIMAVGNEDSKTLHILYVRHGEVPGNAAGIYNGCNTDEPLTENGKAQAAACADKLSQLQDTGAIPKIAAIYASNLKRAMQTAEPIAAKLGLPLESRSDLREIYWGSAEGQPVHEMTKLWKELDVKIRQAYPERRVCWDYLPVFEGAETYNQLLKRTLQEFQNMAALHPGKTVLVVGHGRVLKTLIAEAQDSEENIPYPNNCGVVEFLYSEDEGIRFVRSFD